MAKILDRVARRLGFVPAADAKRAAGRAARRGFEAAQVSRLTASWTRQNLSIDADLRNSLESLRARSRDLSYNNDYLRKFLQMVETNVVGPTGPTLKVNALRPDGTRDAEDSKAVEAAFWDWGKRGVCEMSRKLSIVGVMKLIARAAARDGEWLVRKVRNPTVNRYGYALQILDVDRIATTRNEELKDGRVIKMGVELSQYGEPLALHLHTKHPGDSVYYTFAEGLIERVPMRDLSHGFIPDRAEQTRGFPWAISAMLRLNNLGGYEEAAIIAARIGAAKMGFAISPEGDAEDMSDDTEADGTLVFDAEPGEFRTLPKGYELANWSPEYPHAMYDSFVKACLRGISAGVGVAYNGLSNDLEGVNFSSIRAGVLEERDNWTALQNWFLEDFAADIASDWLRTSLLMGAITNKAGVPLPFAKFDKFNAFEWRGRRWSWVDPKNDQEAAKIAVLELRTKSRRMIAEQEGVEFDDVVAELAAEEAALKSAGLAAAPQAPNGPPRPAPKQDESEAK